MLGAATLTVTPESCPWGFNTANRAPTLMESTAHMLCEIETWTSSTASNLWADIQAFLSWAWDELKYVFNLPYQLGQQIGGAIASAAQTVAATVQAAAQSLWNTVKQVWDWVKAEAAKVGSVAEIALFVGVGVLVLGAISGADYYRESERRRE